MSDQHSKNVRLLDAYDGMCDSTWEMANKYVEIEEELATAKAKCAALEAERDEARNNEMTLRKDLAQLSFAHNISCDTITNMQRQRAERWHGLTFKAFRFANVARCIKWHPMGIGSWSPSDWLTAVTGELGELASLLKMRNRERDGLPGNKFSPTEKQIADELADVFTYLDLLAAALDVDLDRAVVEKFNEVSERVGFTDRIVLYTEKGAK